MTEMFKEDQPPSLLQKEKQSFAKKERRETNANDGRDVIDRLS
jgi:hypothetical protein